MGATVGKEVCSIILYLQSFTKTVCMHDKWKKWTAIYYISKCTLRLQSLLNDALQIIQFNNDASMEDENSSVTRHATEKHIQSAVRTIWTSHLLE